MLSPYLPLSKGSNVSLDCNVSWKTKGLQKQIK